MVQRLGERWNAARSGHICEHCGQKARLRALRAAGFPQIVTSRCSSSRGRFALEIDRRGVGYRSPSHGCLRPEVSFHVFVEENERLDHGKYFGTHEVNGLSPCHSRWELPDPSATSRAKPKILPNQLSTSLRLFRKYLFKVPAGNGESVPIFERV